MVGPQDESIFCLDLRMRAYFVTLVHGMGDEICSHPEVIFRHPGAWYGCSEHCSSTQSASMTDYDNVASSPNQESRI